MAIKTIKLSYSILSQWASGQYEKAVNIYQGADLPITPAMELGRVKHDMWALHTLKHKTIHNEIGGGKLSDPVVEQKYEKIIPLGDTYQILLRGAPDLTDNHIIYEYKCGLAMPSMYVDTEQLDYYKLLYPPASLGIYLCFNPYSETFTKGVKYLSDTNAEKALEHIITYGGEMIDYLASQRLLYDYKPHIYANKK
jgi:hypothetical protein